MISKSNILITLLIINYLILSIFAIDKTDFHSRSKISSSSSSLNYIDIDEFSSYLESNIPIENEFLNIHIDSKFVNNIIVQSDIDSHFKMSDDGDGDGDQSNSTSHLNPYSICIYLLILIISILLSSSLLLL